MQTISETSNAIGIESTGEKPPQRRAESKRKRVLAAAFCVMAGLTSVTSANATALPEGAHLVKGAANIQQVGGDHPVMTIQQQEQIALVEWQAFDIAKNASVHVRSGNRHSLLINRVVGETASTIHGTLKADGAVWLINPNGYLVGERAVIDTREFLAATQDIDPETLLGAADALRTHYAAATRRTDVIRSRHGTEVNVQHARRRTFVRTSQVGGDGLRLEYGIPATLHEGGADVSSSDAGDSQDSRDASDTPTQIRTALAIRSARIGPIPRPLVIPITPPGQSPVHADERSITPLPLTPLDVPPPSPASRGPVASWLPLSPGHGELIGNVSFEHPFVGDKY